MKKFTFFIILVTTNFCFTQNYIINTDSILVNTDSTITTLFNSQFNIKPLSFKSINLKTSNNYFSLYSNNNGLNNVFYIQNDTIQFNHSILIPENNFRGAKIDTFNPNGTNNIGFSIFSGVFDLLFKK